MPLWDPYDEISRATSPISPTLPSTRWLAHHAALFLKRFVPDEIPWAHLDTWAWREAAKPGRPKGGEALGLRAVFETLERLYPSG